MNSGESNDRQLKVDISPEMQIYRVLQHLSYGVETALAELIDNSIQSYVGGRKLPNGGGLDERLLVRIDINENTIILTDNARGINREDIQRAVKPGFESSHSADSLSIYGIGMKSAALWFSEDWSIKTSVPGEPYSLNFNFNLPRLLENHSNSETVEIEDEDASKHYTIITMENVSRIVSKDYYETTVLPFLLETFVKFNSFLDLKIYYNSLLLKPNSKKLRLDIPEPHIYPVVNSNGLITGKVPVEWRIDFDFLHKGRAVRGFILLMEIGGYGQPGIRLLRNNRVIEGTSVYPNVPEKLLGTKNKYAAQRVYGELELNDFPVDFMKTQFNDNLKDLFEEINTRLSNNYYYNLIKQATGYRKKEADKPENQEFVEGMLATMIPVRADSTELAGEPEPENALGVSGGEPTLPPTGGQSGSSGGNTGNLGGFAGHPNGSGPDPTGSTTDPASGGESSNSDKYEPLPENRIELSKALLGALARIPGDKLPQLYTSLCTISLKKHAVMCYVAAWSLLESWSSAMGKADGVDFSSFLNPKVAKFTADKSKKGDLRQVLEDIKSKGNCNKHSAIYGSNHALELKKHFIILESFIIHITNQYLAEEATV
ncbi:ATP-binding protein [Yersinia frederiksenii]|uniref:ATP-binding protein n=1 Tax=Yersinia frederiksenii TaxID=29484 RepID=UPI0005E54DAB|nr:ATP-binding protein [Yersinia frederiksenii]CQH38028.1 Histidine kinase-%2C DNA gyrase B-%2C and HSP90-like ATPase [Yersinia frederiksenii]